MCKKKRLKSLINLDEIKNENSAKSADSRMPCILCASLQRLIEGLASAGGASEEKSEIFGISELIWYCKQWKTSPHIPQKAPFLLFKTGVVRRPWLPPHYWCVDAQCQHGVVANGFTSPPLLFLQHNLCASYKGSWRSRWSTTKPLALDHLDTSLLDLKLSVVTR